MDMFFLKKPKKPRMEIEQLQGENVCVLYEKKYIRRWINFQTELMENGLKERGYKN